VPKAHLRRATVRPDEGLRELHLHLVSWHGVARQGERREEDHDRARGDQRLEDTLLLRSPRQLETARTLFLDGERHELDSQKVLAKDQARLRLHERDELCLLSSVEVVDVEELGGRMCRTRYHHHRYHQHCPQSLHGFLLGLGFYRERSARGRRMQAALIALGFDEFHDALAEAIVEKS